MSRTATAHIHFVQTAVSVEYDGAVTFRDYNVEVRQGQRTRTIGRIHGCIRGGRGTWNALPIGATAWSQRHTTRTAALDALLVREDFQRPTTHIPADGLPRLRRAMVMAAVRHPVPAPTMLRTPRRRAAARPGPGTAPLARAA